MGNGNDSYAVSMLHFQGADGATSILDNAKGGTHIWTAYGNAQLDTAIAKWKSALLLDGAGDWIDTPASNDFLFGSGDFTIDFWMNVTNFTAGHTMIAFYGSDWSTGNWQWFLEINHNAGADEHKLQAAVYDGASRVIKSNAAVSFGTWIHVAIVRSGTTFKMYIGGVEQTETIADLGTLTAPAGTCLCKIGDATWTTSHYYWKGSIDEFRISKGVARWVSGFTPQTIPYYQDGALGNDDLTVSLLHMNGADESTTFVDNAKGGVHTWAAAGNAQIDTAQSKFGGASGLFDGTGDYIQGILSEDWDFGAFDFTWDAWLRFNVLPADGYLMVIEGICDYLITPYGGWMFGLYNNAGTYELRFYFFNSSGGVLASNVYAVTIVTGTWYHVAVIRNGNNLYIALDGVLSSAADWTGKTMVDNGNFCRLGGKIWVDRVDFNGWIDERRISAYIARWSVNFTPPTVEYSEEEAPPGGGAQCVIWIN